MEAYKHSLADGSTTLILSPDSEFFRYFKSLPSPPAAAPVR
jgi:membrane protease subunit HflC